MRGGAFANSWAQFVVISVLLQRAFHPALHRVRVSEPIYDFVLQLVRGLLTLLSGFLPPRAGIFFAVPGFHIEQISLQRLSVTQPSASMGTAPTNSASHL